MIGFYQSMLQKRLTFVTGLPALSGFLFSAVAALANIPGGGTGTGPNVTVTDNGNGTVTMANGVLSILITKNGATVNQMNYTFNNGSGTQTLPLLAGGKNGGQFYWEFGGWGGSSWAYSLATNNGSYAEIDLKCDSATNGLVDIHFSMLRGSPGFYATPIWSHRPQDGAFGTGEERDNIYFAPYFNWMSVNEQVQRETGLNATYAPAFYSPQENSLVTSGVLQGTYDDKYKWSADFGDERVWGWSSVSDPAIGLVGKNVGMWHVVASAEFYNGGPLKPELNDAPMVNMINGGHYYFGNDSGFAAGESWTRVSGPYFIYVNNVTNTLTDPVQTSQALWADAKVQAAAEVTAWPYNWMNNPNYAPASQRGTVAGQMVINDTFNPNASESNLWVGVVQQPAVTINNVYDFQLWMKPYQFWTKTDANGNFVISNVIAGNNYTLYAFGPGASGMFMSQNQSGGSLGITYALPSPQFNVVVSGGTTNNLGAVTWTPTRIGPTVFEIGYPTRKGDKFRHGDDYWVGDVGPSPTAPSPIWTKFMEFPFDFPNGLNYVVGQNRWSTDWNFIQSVYPDFNANNIVSSSTVTFNLATNPASATASLLMGIASDDNSPIYVTVNGTLLSGANCTGNPQTSLPTTGWFPINSSSDTNIREENHGAYSDERLTFAGSLLHAGNNTVNFSFREAGGSGFSHHFIYDYIRLELTGFVPPAPASVIAYAGNNSVLLSWPAVAGATSYNLLRSTNSGSGYVSITNGVVGPVCGSGPANATFVDNTAANGTAYFYAVQSVNPLGASTNSPTSASVTPSGGISTNALAIPTGLAVTSTNNAATFTWNAVPGANFYTVYRGTLVNKLGFVIRWDILSNTTTNPTYTDASGTLGCTYSYYVTVTSAAGTSGNSTVVTAKPVPPPPAYPPANLNVTTTLTSSNQSARITWSPVSGAVGYILYRASSPGGPFSFPGNYVQSMVITNYNDGGLALNTSYYYKVIAMNAGGVSGDSAIVGTPPTPPVSLSAIAGDTKITLNWSASTGATNYVLLRGTSSGGESVIVTSTAATSYTDTNLVNGTTYYYVVYASGSNTGNSGYSPEASATPATSIVIAARDLTWKGDGVANVWDVSGTPNWLSNTVATVFNNGDATTFDDTGSNNIAINIATTVLPSFTTINATKNYTFSGSGAIGGSNILIKAGTGTLTLNTTNTYSGGTIISNGAIVIGNIGANSAAWGSGAIYFYGGTVQFNGYGGNTGTGWGGLTNALVVPLGQTGSLLLPPRWGYSSPFKSSLTGSGTLYVTVDYVRDFFSGNWSGFNGQIIAGPRSGTGDFRIDNTNGYASAALYLNSGVNLYNVNNNSLTIDLGELDGTSGAYIGTGNSASTNPTWRIGAKNTTSTYAGTIADSGVTSLVKIGTGTLILNGANNTYSGGTTVNNGTLQINNAAGSGTGSGAVTVNAGGTLAGSGIISGAVTVQNNGTFAPGNPFGTLTISNNLTLAAGSTTLIQVQHTPTTNSAAKISGILFANGTLMVTNIGTNDLAGGDTFQVFSAGTYSGGFTNLILPDLPAGLTWNTNSLNSSGALSVIVTTTPVIVQVSISPAGFSLVATGGVANANYYLLGTTNLATPVASWTRVATNQFDASGNLSFTNSLNTNSAQYFYQLQLP
jgi:rhamnogalacturonan endolyase